MKQKINENNNYSNNLSFLRVFSLLLDCVCNFARWHRFLGVCTHLGAGVPRFTDCEMSLPTPWLNEVPPRCL